MTPGRSAELARAVAPDRVVDGTEREITVDRSNDCVVVDESVFVKWLTPPMTEPHRGLDVVRHLDATGFEAMPRLLGTQTVGGRVEAIVFEHLAGSDDGWTWLFDRVNASDDGSLAVGELIADATRVGAIAADLHLALAAPSAVMPEPVGTVERSTERARGLALLATALDEVDAVDQPDAHRVLHACRRGIQSLIESIPDGPTAAIALHGDLHMGQLLRSGDRVVVIDFDGNPLLAGSTVVRQPPVVDLASLAQSVDHVVRMTQHRRPGRDEQLDALATSLSLAVVDSYRARIRAAGAEQLLDDALLPALRAMQELHELVYSVRRLPRWAYAPTLALTAMFPHEARS